MHRNMLHFYTQSGYRKNFQLKQRGLQFFATFLSVVRGIFGETGPRSFVLHPAGAGFLETAFPKPSVPTLVTLEIRQ